MRSCTLAVVIIVWTLLSVILHMHGKERKGEEGIGYKGSLMNARHCGAVRESFQLSRTLNPPDRASLKVSILRDTLLFFCFC